MYNTYQEHFDHVTGSQNEFQNAYSLSCSLENDREIPVEGQGGFCVNDQYLAYCRFTDAVIGFRTSREYRFHSFDEAYSFMKAENEKIYKDCAETGDYAEQEFEIPQSQYPPIQGCDRDPEEELYASPF